MWFTVARSAKKVQDVEIDLRRVTKSFLEVPADLMKEEAPSKFFRRPAV